MDKTNSIIKFDLHIHSKASEYKESPGMVDNSTKENLSILFQKLNENEVALFSITDHNRFDADLYREINRLLKEEQEKYPNVKNVLAGVEFDVKLDDDKGKCHIIAIFDAKENDYEKIEDKINQDFLTVQEDFYTKDRFEQLLKNIQLNVILIVHQKKDMLRSGPSKQSLSDACTDAKEIIEFGYINALEFQKPTVQGILRNNLRKLNIPQCSLVSGSDCHNWSIYPPNPEFRHSEAKILPTFKGLLMAVTSPETRFNRTYTDIKPIKSIKINNKEILLTNGINVIIGENGSGKTSLLEALNGKGKSSKSYIQKIIKENSIELQYECSNIEKKYIAQGEIIENFYKGELFEKGNYIKIDNDNFTSKYEKYSSDLYKSIMKNINKNRYLLSLNDECLTYEKFDIKNSHYIDIIDNMEKNYKEENLKEALKKVQNTYNNIQLLLDDKNLEKYKSEIENTSNIIGEILQKIKKQYELIKDCNQVINIIQGRIKDYNAKKINYQSDVEIKNQRYKQKINSFIKNTISAIKNINTSVEWPEKPNPISGFTSNKKAGFNFNLEAYYNNRDVFPDFLEIMFKTFYRNIENIKGIITIEKFQDAVLSCSKIDEIEKIWNKNYDKFIEKELKQTSYLSEETGSNKIGNTLGEISLTYYKYCTNEEGSLWNLLMIDQPEDNISNNNIKEKLISYFNTIRNSEYNKQIIFVTHNPLLVVNLDADNVIFLKNNNGSIESCSGCLEYEDTNTNILDLVANNMDGGRDTIERRLKIYGKKHKM